MARYVTAKHSENSFTVHLEGNPYSVVKYTSTKLEADMFRVHKNFVNYIIDRHPEIVDFQWAIFNTFIRYDVGSDQAPETTSFIFFFNENGLQEDAFISTYSKHAFKIQTDPIPEGLLKEVL